MSKYKVGDIVWVKERIEDIDSNDGEYFMENENGGWFGEYKILGKTDDIKNEYDRALCLLFNEIMKINKEREEYVDSLIKENNWQDYQLDKLADEKVKIIKALEEKIKYSHLSVKGGRANGKSIDYGYKVGLCDALKLVKEGGME